jgi:hypothetical protein
MYNKYNKDSTIDKLNVKKYITLPDYNENICYPKNLLFIQQKKIT